VATKFYVAGLSERVIAEIMGWKKSMSLASPPICGQGRRDEGDNLSQHRTGKGTQPAKPNR